MDHGANDSRRLIESFRLMLAIIAGLLMLDMAPTAQGPLSLAVLAYSAYAAILLWQAASGSALAQHRVFYWLDSCWFLLLLALAGPARMQYFLLLFFPVFFAAWRTGYRESVAIAAFSGLASLVIIAYGNPAISWTRLLALPLSLFVVGPLFVALVIGIPILQVVFVKTCIDRAFTPLPLAIYTVVTALAVWLCWRAFRSHYRTCDAMQPAINLHALGIA